MNKKKPNTAKPTAQPSTLITLIPLPTGAKVRTLEATKQVSLFDVFTAMGDKSPRESWARLQKTHPEVVALSDGYQFSGKGQQVTPVVDKAGLVSILLLLPGEKAAQFRKGAAQIIVRYLEGDASLASEIIDRNPDPKAAMAWVAQRQEAKESNHLLNGCIDAHGGDCFVQVAIYTSRAATDKTPKQLRAERGGKDARDTMNTGELAAVALTEALTRTSIENTDARGNTKIIAQSYKVAKAVAKLRREFGGKAFHANPSIQTPKKLPPPPAPKFNPQLSLF